MVGKYCSIDKTMLPQKNENNTCDNNFECTINVCSEKCISLSFIQKIIKWFEQLFGING